MSITSSASYLISYQNTLNESYRGLVGTAIYPATTQLIGTAVFTSNAPFSNVVYTAGYNCNAVYFPGTAGAYYNYGTGTTFPLVNLTASNLFVEAWAYFNNFQSNILHTPVYMQTFGSASVPTTNLYSATTYTTVGSPTMFNDSTRGYVLNTGAGIALNSTFTLPISYTKSVWVYATGTLGNGNVVSSSTNTAGVHYLWFNGTSNMRAGHNSGTTVTGYVADPSTYIANTWIHYTVTYDNPSTTMILYRNGVSVNSATNAALNWTGGNGIALGAFNGGSVITNAYLDNVIIYARALTANEVSQLYTTQLNNPTANNTLVGYNYIIQKAVAGVGGATDWGMFTSNNTLVGYYNSGSTYVYASNTTPLSTNTWYHTAMSYNSNTKTITTFLNGVPGTPASNTSITSANAGTTILLGYYNASAYANMYVADLRVMFSFDPTYIPNSNTTFIPAAPQLTYAPPSYASNVKVLINLMGQFLTYVPGKYGTALCIQTPNNNCYSYVSYNFLSRLSLLNGVTITCWINFNTLSVLLTSYRMSIFNFNTSGVLSQGLWLSIVNNSQFQLSYANGEPGTIQGFTSASYTYSSVTSNVWYHVGATTAAGEHYLYFNGSLVGTGTYAIPYYLLEYGSLNIGCHTNSAAVEGFNGLIQDVRVFNKVLTATQITAIYNASASNTYTLPSTISSTVTSSNINTSLQTFIKPQPFPLGTLSSSAIVSMLGAFSLKAVMSSSARVINVSNVASGLTQDFYADIYGNLSTAAVSGTNITSWLGGATGYITTWYDQSFNGNHMTAIVANRPTIDTINNYIDFKTSAYFDTSVRPSVGPVPYNSALRYTIICHHNTIGNNTGGICGCQDGVRGATNNNTNNLRRATANYQNYWFANDFTNGTYVAGNIVTMKWDGTNRTIYGNGTLQATLASSGWRQTTSANQMIGKTTSDVTMNGEMYSLFTFTTALSDADRIIVEAAS